MKSCFDGYLVLDCAACEWWRNTKHSVGCAAPFPIMHCEPFAKMSRELEAMAKQETGYSQLYKAKSGRQYRYDYDNALLEYVSTEDVVWNGDEPAVNGVGVPVKVKLDTPEVVDSYGLSADEWRDNPEYWVETMDSQVAEEVACLVQDFLTNG